MFTPRWYQSEITNAIFTYIERYKTKHPLAAAPTGSGKTIIIAEIIKTALEKWPSSKILVLSHVKEILEQDYNSLKKHIKGVPIGLYSAGMNKRDIKKITIAGIQSVFRRSDEFREFNFVIIDEAHLIPLDGNGMYRTFFNGLNNVIYIGLTATPYRLSNGLIYGKGDDTIFDNLVYDLTSKEKFNRLIKEGYLCNLKTKATAVELDTTGIGIKAGDFAKDQLSKAFDRDTITNMAVDEIIKSGQDYKKWLVFAIDIAHAEHVAETMSKKGIPTMIIHSKMEFDRDTVIRSYKSGMFRCIVNVNVLTTGFDDPEIDLIALLRPTQSPVIHVQTIGRGLRVFEGKPHCLILDFAGNTERLGPINDIRIVERKKKGDGTGEPITKLCPNCDVIHAVAVRVCEFCGFKFEFKTNLKAHASNADVISNASSINWYSVIDVTYQISKKKNSPDILLVTYQCGLRFFKEWVCLEHKGFAGRKARHWAAYRGVPVCNDVADLFAKSIELKKPNKIKVDTSGKYPLILDFSF